MANTHQIDPEFEQESEHNFRSAPHNVEAEQALLGAIFVNKIDRAGIVCGLIRDGVNVANFKDALLDDNFGYLSLPPKLRRDRLDTLGVKQC